MKFLIDECLSPELAKRAEAAGHAGSSHVVWLGRSGAKDWELKPLILAGDWTFVTRNAIDFRGAARGRDPAASMPTSPFMPAWCASRVPRAWTSICNSTC